MCTSTPFILENVISLYIQYLGYLARLQFLRTLFTDRLLIVHFIMHFLLMCMWVWLIILRLPATPYRDPSMTTITGESPETVRSDERIFWQDIQSIVSVNDRDVSVLSPADLKPGDTVLVQHIGKHNKPGRPRWKAVVMDKDEVAEAQAAARLSLSPFSQGSETDTPCQRSSRKRKATSTEPGCKQAGGTKKLRNKGVLWFCWYCSCIIYCRL